MILKELDSIAKGGPFEEAGRTAEEQMQYYLKREFGHYKDRFVLNGLRLEHEGDACQIDHLIVHPWGFTIIESKSVTTEVRIDEQGEWSRLVGGSWKGMASPINQAQLQLKLLRLLLLDQAPNLYGKLYGVLQKRYGGLQRDVYAAVSDNGIVSRPVPGSHPNVLKADAVCSVVISKLRGYERGTGMQGFMLYIWRPLAADAGMIRMTDDETLITAKFLLDRHRPRPAPSKDAPSDVSPVTSSILVLPDNMPPNPTLNSPIVCKDCHCRLSQKVLDYCRRESRKFSGNLYCYSCQQSY